MPQGPIAGAIVVFNAFGELDREMAAAVDVAQGRRA